MNGTTHDVRLRAEQLIGERRPFVTATVVRAQQPTSAHPGDTAIVFSDGTIEGFVGGQCAQNSVREAARGALDSGESVLLRVLPDGAPPFPKTSGADVVVNPCLSGGAMEIFLEPTLPAHVLSLYGDTPIADAVVEFARVLDLDVVRSSAAEAVNSDATAVIIASLGGEEALTIRAALDAGVQYIGLVASRVRGAAVLEQLELTDSERARVHTPVGMYIGAKTPAEIALSIVVDVVRAIRLDGVSVARNDPVAKTALDPICGMTVTITADTPHLEDDGVDVWFCSPVCRHKYEKT
ncbi:MAG: carbon monoxide dehydrogenase accessory protein [Rhodococcus sp. (in: high G+C Gram-positive bacteria)]|uniref:XdhC family protein n=1 Tax=Rhodococcus sp. TaxID=1831 RepID=UPI001215343E|nr:XdhC family protein [Rhodococcus sp. (in: high G+C Gram-positive bacteria)]RZL22250.1 MAG: carbon monoxide dehydrogenase accessory protein [Rhodococcus sp. (in: high G+C Gram-positive bacteria)]